MWSKRTTANLYVKSLLCTEILKIRPCRLIKPLKFTKQKIKKIARFDPTFYNLHKMGNFSLIISFLEADVTKKVAVKIVNLWAKTRQCYENASIMAIFKMHIRQTDRHA